MTNSSLSLSKTLSPAGWQSPPAGEQTNTSAPSARFDPGGFGRLLFYARSHLRAAGNSTPPTALPSVMTATAPAARALHMPDTLIPPHSVVGEDKGVPQRICCQMPSTGSNNFLFLLIWTINYIPDDNCSFPCQKIRRVIYSTKKYRNILVDIAFI